MCFNALLYCLHLKSRPPQDVVDLLPEPFIPERAPTTSPGQPPSYQTLDSTHSSSSQPREHNSHASAHRAPPSVPPPSFYNPPAHPHERNEPAPAIVSVPEDGALHSAPSSLQVPPLVPNQASLARIQTGDRTHRNRLPNRSTLPFASPPDETSLARNATRVLGSDGIGPVAPSSYKAHSPVPMEVDTPVDQQARGFDRLGSHTEMANTTGTDPMPQAHPQINNASSTLSKFYSHQNGAHSRASISSHATAHHANRAPSHNCPPSSYSSRAPYLTSNDSSASMNGTNGSNGVTSPMISLSDQFANTVSSSAGHSTDYLNSTSSGLRPDKTIPAEHIASSEAQAPSATTAPIQTHPTTLFSSNGAFTSATPPSLDAHGFSSPPHAAPLRPVTSAQTSTPSTTVGVRSPASNTNPSVSARGGSRH